MDKDIKDLIIEESKNNMPDLWDRIENKLEDKKVKNKRKLMSIAASLAVILMVGAVGAKVIHKDNFISSNTISEEQLAQVDEIENRNEAVNEKNELNSTYEANKNNNYDANYSEFSLEDTIGDLKEIEVLEDLDFEKITEGKTVINQFSGNKYVGDSRFINYEEEAGAVVYGRVTSVKSYNIFTGMIYSDITIEVIKDYRNVLKAGENITICQHGGELTYGELIEQLSEEYVEKHDYNNVQDKSQKVIEIWDGIPVYREGEYVLVYADSLDNDQYYNENQEYKDSITYDYILFKGFYVNPNSKEIFDYKYSESGKIKKVGIGNLDSLENQN